MKKVLLLPILAMLMLASCHSSKKAAKDGDDKTQPTTTVVTPTTKGTTTTNETPTTKTKEKAIAPGTNFTAKVRVTIVQNGKDITTNGNLRMRYDDVIQITLVDPLLGITEVGRLELSPDRMLIIDRINKRYVDTTYDEMTALKSKNIDFATIQDFFWKEAQSSDELSYTVPAKTPIQLDLKLSGKGNLSNWNAHTTVSDKYTKTEANKLFGNIVNQ